MYMYTLREINRKKVCKILEIQYSAESPTTLITPH